MSLRRLRASFLLVACLLCFNDTEETSDVEPLYMTPYIEEGRIEEARMAANVTSFVDGMESYSGYLTVNKTCNSNLFFWFVKSQAAPWENRPLIVWIQGGPGQSALVGMLNEIGPFKVSFRQHEQVQNTSSENDWKDQSYTDEKIKEEATERKRKHRSSDSWNKDFELIRREHYWNKKYNILFLDHPVGAGFSFTEDDSCYTTNVDEGARDYLEALSQFYRLFLELQRVKLYLVGESYGTRFTVGAAHRLNDGEYRNIIPAPSGVIIWSGGYLDPISMTNYGSLLYCVGLIDRRQLQEFFSREDDQRRQIKAQNYIEAAQIYKKQVATITALTGFQHLLDITRDYLGTGMDTPTYQFLNRTDVRKRIHVGYKIFNTAAEAMEHLAGDFMKSVKSLFEDILNAEAFPIMCVTGGLDLIGSYKMTTDFIYSMKWVHDTEYYESKRCIFKIGNYVAAYYKKAGMFTEVMVRNTGHWIANVEPQAAFEILEAFIENKSTLQCS